MIKVTSFYKFFPIKKSCLKALQKELVEKASSLNIRGLVLIAEEGLNATLCGPEEPLEVLKKHIVQLFEVPFFWKDSYCERWNFKRLSVKVKKEIVKWGEADTVPFKGSISHLSPKNWEEKLKAQPYVLDVRNVYEVEIGKFQRAEDLQLNSFQEFPQKLDRLSHWDKNKETLIYCTGGIRCEKAIGFMQQKGFKSVYQLQGGILNYLREKPRSQFKGECFVFDHRVALNQDLQEEKNYSLCPHCGGPGRIKISCGYCGGPAVVCPCSDRFFYRKTCSKNCAYHFRLGHKCRKKANRNLEI